MKKIFVIFLLSIFLIGCGSIKNVNTKPRIGLIISSLENPFFTELADQMALEAEKWDYELTILDSKDDVNLEIEHVQQLIDEKNDILLINPVDVTKSSEAVLISNKAEIPVITIDRTVERGEITSNISSDNYMGGQLVGELLLKKINYSGKLFILEGLIETSANTERIAGLLDTINTFDIEIVGRTTANFDRKYAYGIIVQMIKSNLEVDVIFAANDEMALGAIDALIDYNRNIIVYGYDGNIEAIKAVVDGYLAGTIAQQPLLIAKKSIEVVNDILMGKSVDTEIKVPVEVVTLDK